MQHLGEPRVAPLIAVLLAAAVTSGFFGQRTFAATVEYVSQGAPIFRFDVPDDWQFRIGPDVPAADMPQGTSPAPRVISVRPPGEDGVMWTGLWSPPGVESFADARDYLRRLGPRLMDGPQVGYRNERSVNGRPARIFSGTGTRMGRDFDFVFAVVQIAPGRIAVAAFIGEPGIFDRYEAQLVDLLDSLEPVEAVR
jgi:hypothetical protein